MVPLMSLWMPMVLAAVLVFVASSVIHMMLGYHYSDYGRMPDEDKVMDALRDAGAGASDYMVPCGDGPSAMRDPEFIEKFSKGPVALVTIWPAGPPAMGKQLGMWFAYCLFISLVAAYVGGRALGPGAEYLEVFRFVGTTAFAGYALAHMQNSIWFRRKWSTTFKHMFDGLVYAMLTAGAFGWLWPS